MKTRFLLCLVTLFSSVLCHAYDFEYGGLYYKYVEGHSACEVTYNQRGQDYSGDITIPSEIELTDGVYSVVGVESGAFSESKGLTSITFGGNIRYI
jgi:hypothetical protein